MYSNNSGNGSSIENEKKSKKNSNIEMTGGIRKNKESNDPTPGEKRERSGSKRRKKSKSKESSKQ